MTHFSFEKGSSLAFFLHSSFFWIYHITSSALSARHLARWPSISSCDSLQRQNLFTEKHLHCSSPSLPQFLSNHGSSSGFMGKSLLCSEAPQSATSPCSCYHLLLDSLMSFSRRQCSHSVCPGQVLLSLEPSGY